jgi:hypothetical protein
VDSVFLDFSKAFDMVPHNRLISKLAKLGINDQLKKWIQSFLSNRIQIVRVGTVFSEEVSVTSGVPQGSVLGPLLFLIFINDLPDNAIVSIRLFADDCIVYSEVNDPSDCIILEKALQDVCKWCDDNGMKLNTDKSQLLSFTNRRNQIRYNYKLGNEKLDSVTSAKYLGVNLASNLSWNNHLDAVVSKANQAMNFISRNCQGMGKEARQLASFSLVRPHLEYAAMVWDPSQQYWIEKLEGIQRKAARFVLGRYGRYSSVRSMLQLLGWDSLEMRRKLARLSGLYRAYHNHKGWEEILYNNSERPFCLSVRNYRRNSIFSLEPEPLFFFLLFYQSPNHFSHRPSVRLSPALAPPAQLSVCPSVRPSVCNFKNSKCKSVLLLCSYRTLLCPSS